MTISIGGPDKPVGAGIKTLPPCQGKLHFGDLLQKKLSQISDLMKTEAQLSSEI